MHPKTFCSLFLSTPSARRATKNKDSFISVKPISIHALREEGDYSGQVRHTSLTDFYPRPPRGGRRENKKTAWTPKTISIHALREEGDSR